MKIIKVGILFLVLIIICHQVFAQTVSGRIVDTNKKGIPECYIILNKTETHVHTDPNGKFSFDHVKIGDSLVVRHIGFLSQTYKVKDLSKELIIILEKSTINLSEVSVIQNVKALNIISDINALTNPVNSSQEILRAVPGLFIGQHAGGGKAEQIFLRGFDVDHGTDVAIDVDGIPVNMVSHGHGQGYADLHFLIPETVDKIDFGKGSYFADKGNFNTAGYISFKTKESLDKNSVTVDVGRFNTYRTLGLINIVNNEYNSAYLATEYQITDGPFESSQNFNRFNIMGKYTTKFHNLNRLTLIGSYFTSEWTASGQIPERGVRSGLITRFGAIDDTEGGKTSRANFAGDLLLILSEDAFLKTNFFLSKYDFTLFSNFTFFLNDPVNADQIKQDDHRLLGGFKSEFNQSTVLGDRELLIQTGIGLRHDQNEGVGLFRTKNRTVILNKVQFGNITETNAYGYINLEYDINKLLINPALRVDYFNFRYTDLLMPSEPLSQDDKAILSPKLNFIYNHNDVLQLFLKTGYGFHSNDSRVVLESNKTTIPAAITADLGTIFKPTKNIIVNASLWYLDLDQEFVYVGDEGVIEPSGHSVRQGIDYGIQYQITDHLFFNTDISYNKARSVDNPEGEQFIPLAPDLTTTLGVAYKKNQFKAQLKSRFLKSRPANEDNSIRAEGYFITDLNASYQFNRFNFAVLIENLFNNEWKETQFATESRLRNETNSVEEIHFTPDTPFFFKLRVGVNF